MKNKTSLVGLTVLFATLIGISQTIVMVLPLAIFLAKYDSSLLTYIYISNGVIVCLLGFFFRFAQNKMSSYVSSVWSLVLMCISLLFFWILLETSDFEWLPMALCIWAQVCFTFLNLVLTTLLVCLFFLQEAKRFSGIIEGAKASGSIITGFSIPFLVQIAGFKNTFFLAPFMILLGIFSLFLLKKHHSDRVVDKPSNEAPISLHRLKNKSYIMGIFLLNAVSLFNYFSIDLLFNTEVKMRYASATEMAGFLGVFTGFASVLTLIGGFFVFGWLLKKIGVIATLFLTPMIIAGLGTAVICMNLVPRDWGLVFGLLAVLALSEKMLRQSINGGALGLLYQPLRQNERLWALLQFKTIIQPLGISAIGVFLFLISRYFGIHILNILLAVVGVSICGIGIMFFIKKAYIKALMNSLNQRNLFNPEFVQLDKISLKVLKERLKSPYPDEVIYVLQTIEKGDPAAFEKGIQDTLDSPFPEVRNFSLRKIEEYQIQAAKDKVETICLSEKDPPVLASAINAMGALGPLDQYPWFQEHLRSPNLTIAASSLIAFLRHGDKQEGLALLSRKLHSSHEEDRIVAANVLSAIEVENRSDFLIPLLQDSEAVRLAAIPTAAKVQNEKIYAALIESLTAPRLHFAAYKSLKILGEEKNLSVFIAKHFEKVPLDTQCALIELLSSMKREWVQSFLESLLTQTNRRIFHETLRALEKLSYKSSKISFFQGLLASENQNILDLQKLHSALHSEKAQLLHDLLSREIELTQERCFFMLTFIYPEGPIRAARQGIASGDLAAVSYAAEILLEVLSKEDSGRLVPQLTFLPYVEWIEKREESIEEAVLEVLKWTPHCVLSAIHAAVFYTIGVLKIKSLKDMVQKSEVATDPLMAEMRTWTLKKLAT